MNEIVIKKLECFAGKHIVQAIVVEGKVLPNEQWCLKSNAKLTITFISQVITKKLNKETYFIDFTIEQPNFDVRIFDKPTSWIKTK